LSAVTYLINGRIYLLSERSNEQGLLDMGCAPNLLPGYRPLGYAEFRKKYDAAWKTSIPEQPGLTIFEMIEAAKNGSLKGMYIMGENPVFNLPNSGDVEAALKKIDFLVVQDIFLTETGKLADVVLPALSWSEKTGTFTNMERRIQRVRKAVTREGSMEDWRIISEVSGNMASKMHYTTAEDVFSEISKVSPLHRDLTYEEIEKETAIYPYKGEPLRSLPGEIRAENSVGPVEAGKYYLRLERPLFHSGTLSRKAKALVNICDAAVVRISPTMAGKLAIKEGDVVKISTRAGSFDLPVAVDNFVDDSVVMLTNNFEARGAFSLMECTIDPVTKAPVIDGNVVIVEKVAR
jgi:predicted molibdopterin-dependent oxidoreductase YjgC